MPRQPTLSRRPRDHNAHGWTLLERAERSSSDEGEVALSQHQRLVRQNKAIKFFRRIGLKILYATKLCAMYRNLLRWELQAQLETEEQRASSMALLRALPDDYNGGLRMSQKLLQ